MTLVYYNKFDDVQQVRVWYTKESLGHSVPEGTGVDTRRLVWSSNGSYVGPRSP